MKHLWFFYNFDPTYKFDRTVHYFDYMPFSSRDNYSLGMSLFFLHSFASISMDPLINGDVLVLQNKANFSLDKPPTQPSH